MNHNKVDIIKTLEIINAWKAIFKFFFVVWLFCTSLIVSRGIIMFPETGKFFLAVRATIFSNQVRYFFISFLAFLALTSFSFIILYGDTSFQFDGIGTSMFSLGILGFTGEQPFLIDEITLSYDRRAVLARLLIFLFTTIASVILVNLLIGVLSDVWKDQLKKALWEDYVDAVLKEVLKRRFAEDEHAKDFYTRIEEWIQRRYTRNYCSCGFKGKYVGYLHNQKNPLRWICCCCVYKDTHYDKENNIKKLKWSWQPVGDEKNEYFDGNVFSNHENEEVIGRRGNVSVRESLRVARL